RDPLQMAIEGNAFFALLAEDGQRVYTQNVRLGIDADGQLVDRKGARVLGNNVDANFRLDRTEIEAIQLPLARSPAPNARLNRIEVSENGEVRGSYSDGVSRIMGQIRMTEFADASNLREIPDTRFTEGLGSGLATLSADGSSRIVSGARRLSNTDIAGDLVSLTKSGVMFRANLQVLETSEELLESLYGLGRR
ncbi:MAG: flagellar basal body rod C-terminal domain-containing protein, partial [Planctomycetota bacterium]